MTLPQIRFWCERAIDVSRRHAADIVELNRLATSSLLDKKAGQEYTKARKRWQTKK